MRWLHAGILLFAAHGAHAASAPPGHIVISWTDNASDESGYRIERCQVIPPALDCANFVQIAQVGSGSDICVAKTYINASLVVGSQWCYRVRAFNGAGNSGYTLPVCGTATLLSPPLDPTDLVVQ